MSISRSLRILTAASLLTATFLTLQPPQTAYAQSIEINSTADVVADDGQCTLREAIIAANTDTASGTLAGECRAGNGEDVVYVPNGTYTLTSGSELTIGSNLWLIGQSEAGTIIQAAAAPDTVNYRVMTITGNNVRLGRLTIRNGGCRDGCVTPGPTQGGGLLNQGLDNYLLFVTISSNEVIQQGNGIYNSGRMGVFNSTIADNQPSPSIIVGGGGVYNSGNFVMVNSVVANNISGGPNSFGGGFYNTGQLQIYNSTISGNVASVGSAIHNQGANLFVSIWDSTLVDNPGSALSIYMTGTVDIKNSTVNSSGAQNNGILFNSGATVRIENSTIAGHNWNAIITTPTASGTIQVINSTVASNGWGLSQAGGTVTVTNSIIANNTTADCSGTIGTGGYNIASDATCVGFIHPNDQTSTNPLLNALADNGGPTQTMALQASSPAIDQGDDTVCSNITTVGSVDQRGAIRPFDDPASPGTACDIGAFEFGAASNDYPDAFAYDTNVAEDNTLIDVVPFNDPDGDLLGNYSPTDVRPVHDQFFDLDIDGNLTYTPLSDFNGYDAFIYQSGHRSDPTTINRYRESYSLVLIRVDPENDPPVNTVPATATVVVSTPTGIGGVSVDDPDVDENPGGQMQITLTATNGTVSVPGTSGATVNNNGTANVTITGTLAQVNAELAGIQFTGAAVGPATLQVLSNDLGNWGAPGALTDTDTIDITVIDTPPPAPGGGGSGGASSAPVCVVTIDVEADKEVVSIGDPVWWTVEIRNVGPVDCHGLILIGTFSDGLIIRDIATSQGTITRDDPRFEVDLGTISVSQMVLVTGDTLVGGGAGFSLPEGAAGQNAGTQLCLTGRVNGVTDTDCVTLFPDNLPSTGGQPVNWWKHYGVWIGAGLISLLAAGGWWVTVRKCCRVLR